VALSKGQLLEKAQHVVNLLYHEYIPANLFTFIGVTFLKIFQEFSQGSDNIRRFPKTFRRSPKMLRRVPSNTNTGTQRNIDFLLKKENSEKVDHLHRLFFSLFGSGLFK